MSENPIIEVTLVPHIAEIPFGDVKVPTSMGQSYIMLGGRHCGWMPDPPGSTPLLFRSFGEENNAEIKRQIDEIRGCESPTILFVERVADEEAERVRQNVGGAGPADDEDNSTGFEDEEF